MVKCILRMFKFADMAKGGGGGRVPRILGGHCFLCRCLGIGGENRGRSGSEPDTLPEVGQVASVDAQALACQLSRHRPTAQAINHSRQEAWDKKRAKEQGGTSQRWVDVGLLAACGDAVPCVVFASPQVWSNVLSALETGWASVEPSHPISLGV